MKRAGAPFHVARRVSTDPGELHRLRHHANPGVRLGVAANPSTRRDTFFELLATVPSLAGGAQADLIAACLSNPNVLMWLLEDPTWLQSQPIDVASAIARWDALTPLLWAALSGHASMVMRLALLRSRAAPHDAWQRIGFPTAGALDLGDAQLGRDQLAVLTSSPPLAGITSLDLRGNHLDPLCMELLSSCPHLASLTALNLSGNQIGDRGVEELARSTAMPHLAELHLSLCEVGPAGLAALARSAHFPALRRLDLLTREPREMTFDPEGRVEDEGESFARIHGRDIEPLVQSRSLRDLTELNLGFHPLGDEGATLLAASPLAGLVRLALTHCELSREGARALLTSPRLVSLQHLDLSDNRGLDEADHEALRQAAARRPGLTLTL